VDENDIVYLRTGRLVRCNMGVSNYRVIYIYIICVCIYIHNDMFIYIANEQTYVCFVLYIVELVCFSYNIYILCENQRAF
jgi:hypothetical protein